MQKASESVSSGLMSVFLSRQSKLNLAMLGARKWCKEKLKLDDPIECEIANYLFSQCKVIGGNTEALDFIETNYKEFNINRIKRLPVSGAFHTSLMKQAEQDVKNELENIIVKKPIINLYSNYDASLCMNPKKIKFNLVRQISNPVKWEQILNEFYFDENLPLDSAKTKPVEDSSDKIDKKAQSKMRVYPDIYECGPASQTGPILKAINFKAHQFYKHVDV